MTISLDQGTLRLTGACGVEEAETLVTYLETQPDLCVDISGAMTLHTALWQALMVLRPRITGSPPSSVAMDHAFRALKAFQRSSSA